MMLGIGITLCLVGGVFVRGHVCALATGGLGACFHCTDRWSVMGFSDALVTGGSVRDREKNHINAEMQH